MVDAHLIEFRKELIEIKRSTLSNFCEASFTHLELMQHALDMDEYESAIAHARSLATCIKALIMLTNDFKQTLKTGSK